MSTLANLSRRKAMAVGLRCAGATLLPACGAIIYPERKGNTPEGHVTDGMICLLDGLLCLLFLVPGIIAFVVDVSTGCIYMPSREGRFRRVRARSRHRKALEAAIHEATGVELVLDDPRLMFIGKPMALDAHMALDAEFLLRHARPIDKLRLLADQEGEFVGFTILA
jgi:hypothetical protein